MSESATPALSAPRARTCSPLTTSEWVELVSNRKRQRTSAGTGKRDQFWSGTTLHERINYVSLKLMELMQEPFHLEARKQANEKCKRNGMVFRFPERAVNRFALTGNDATLFLKEDAALLHAVEACFA